MSTQNTKFILVLLFVNHCTRYLYYNYKPSFAHPVYIYTHISDICHVCLDMLKHVYTHVYIFLYI